MNTVRNSPNLVASLTGNNSVVYSIRIPQECDEIRFQLYNNREKNSFCYSFDDKFSVDEVNTFDATQSLSIYRLPFLNAETQFLMMDSQSLGYSQEIIIRNPSDFGETIYFFCNAVGVPQGIWGVQWQIIGGCNPNGY